MKTLLTPDVLTLLTALDGNARLVGGCVRDCLMHTPVQDIDIATSYKPTEVVERLTAQGIRTIPTGIKHGTITAVVNKTPYEITTLRTDIESDGRHAKISFTNSYEEDSHRRDFTVNALYIDINGKLYDYTNGQEDIKNKIVRFIGNPEKRITEDYLRILRYFRFWGKMGHHFVDESAVNTCQQYAPCLKKISTERKRDELFKILMQERAYLTLSLMSDTNVLQHILPQTSVKSLERFLRVYPNSSILQRLSILTQGNAPDLALSNAQKKELSLFAKQHNLNTSVSDNKFLLYTVGKHAFDFYIYRALSEEKITQASVAELLSIPEPIFPITGSDLLQMGILEGIQMNGAIEETQRIWKALDFTSNKKLVLNKLITYNKK